MIDNLLNKIEDCLGNKQPYFYLSNLKLKAIPKEIGKLKELKVLDLSNNELTEIPKELCDLKNLKILDLKNNKLKQLPIEVALLKNLETLLLTNNSLEEIPVELINLPRLTTLDLKGNPLTKPPLEIINRGLSSIRNYLESIVATKESIKLYEAKLLIVGEGNVGKSFLMNRIIHNQVNGDETTTEGIDIKKWEIETHENSKFSINFWDFGGQEIYHSTHQFFLTKRSLYLFVWNARTDDNLISFDYWLNVINLLGDGSPVIIVQNKIDERIKNIDEETLKRKFQNIISFHKVSAKEGTNLESLINDIKSIIIKLDHVGDTLPKVWNDIRKELEQSNDNYISFVEYKEICLRFGLDTRQASFLSQYFHDLGVILHFQENGILNNIVFLKPEWATNAVYKLVDTKSIIENFGRFSFSDLFKIWQEYPEEYYIHLVELMKKFELCFQLVNSENYIIPELLKPENSNVDWQYDGNIHFRYSYEFMPKGIITRFIVRTHDLIKEESYWKNGVILRREATEALIVNNKLDRSITVRIRGYNKKGLLSIIRREIDYIHKSLNEPTVKEMVPCCCTDCSSKENPHFYDYKTLKRYEEKKKDTITCPVSIEEVTIRNLVDGFEGNVEIGDAEGNYLIRKLKQCKKGKEAWAKYEEICTDIFEYLFKDTFTKYISQSQSGTIDGILRRDLIVNNNYKDTNSFWARMKQDFKCDIILVDFKNYKEQLTANDLHLPSKYLGSIGKFGIVISRFGLDETAKKLQIRQLRQEEFILSLTDSDLEKMIDIKMKGEDPLNWLHKLHFDLIKSL